LAHGRNDVLRSHDGASIPLDRLKQALWPVVFGLGAGLAGTYYATHLIASFLFQTTPYDPPRLVIVVARPRASQPGCLPGTRRPSIRSPPCARHEPAARLPEGSHGVLRDQGIRRNDRQPVHDRLADQDPIERIPMAQRQLADVERGFLVNGK